MVAEVLAGIALVNSAVKGIKSVIGTCRDVSEIADQIDSVITGTKQVHTKSHPIASKWDNFIGKRLGSSGDAFSLGSIAKETIEEKLAEEQLDLVRRMINKRFGPDTWGEIIEERRIRIEAHEKRMEKARKQEKKKRDEIYKVLEYIGGIILVGISGIIAFWLIVSNMKK